MAAAFAVPDADRHRALGGHHVAAREDPRVAGHHVRTDRDDAVLDLEPGDASSSERSVPPSASTSESGLHELAGGLGWKPLVQLHPLDEQDAFVGVGDRREPLHQDAFLLGLLDSEVARASGRGCAGRRRSPPPPSRCPRRIHRRAAAAVDDDATAEQRALLLQRRAA